MSEENVQIVRQVVEEFEAGMERGDPGAAFDTGAIADDYEHILEVTELEGRWPRGTSEELPEPRRSPRSRRAAGVGDVGRERRDCAARAGDPSRSVGASRL